MHSKALSVRKISIRFRLSQHYSIFSQHSSQSVKASKCDSTSSTMAPTGLNLSVGRVLFVPRHLGTSKSGSEALQARPSQIPVAKHPCRARTATRHMMRSHSSDMASNESDFDLSNYRQAEVLHVKQQRSAGDHKYPPQWMIVLKIEEAEQVLPIYVGESEGSSLNAALHAQQAASRYPERPRTYDMMKSALIALGARVTKVCITALVDNTYLAKAYFHPDGGKQERAVDSRPSDALNLALRFGAPVYVNKAVVSKMAIPVEKIENKIAKLEPVPSEIEQSCKDALTRYHDPTVVCKVNLQVAIKEDRFEDAAKIRDQIEKHLSQDRTLSLAVAMQSALEDKRFEEAASLRDQLMEQIEGSPSEKLQDIV